MSIPVFLNIFCRRTRDHLYSSVTEICTYNHKKGPQSKFVPHQYFFLLFFTDIGEWLCGQLFTNTVLQPFPGSHSLVSWSHHRLQNSDFTCLCGWKCGQLYFKSTVLQIAVELLPRYEHEQLAASLGCCQRGRSSEMAKSRKVRGSEEFCLIQWQPRSGHLHKKVA